MSRQDELVEGVVGRLIRCDTEEKAGALIDNVVDALREEGADEDVIVGFLEKLENAIRRQSDGATIKKGRDASALNRIAAEALARIQAHRDGS